MYPRTGIAITTKMCNQTALFFHQITQCTSQHDNRKTETDLAPTAASHGCIPPLPAFATAGEYAASHRLPFSHSAQLHCSDVAAPRRVLPTVTAISKTHAQRKSTQTLQDFCTGKPLSNDGLLHRRKTPQKISALIADDWNPRVSID
jgi:hypothetical protein